VSRRAASELLEFLGIEGGAARPLRSAAWLVFPAAPLEYLGLEGEVVQADVACGGEGLNGRAPGAIFESAVDPHHGADAAGGRVPDPHHPVLARAGQALRGGEGRWPQGQRYGRGGSQPAFASARIPQPYWQVT
jgi:hypothetical protein